jgi:DNA-binding transcriptional regulator YiaG
MPKNKPVPPFSAQIKSERKRLGLTPAEVGNVLGVSKSIVEKWEAEERTPKPLTASAALDRLRSFPTPA